MNMVYIFYANGFEETEAIVPTDILRRAGLELKTVGIGGKIVKGAHGISVICDICEDEIAPDKNLTCVILPGGGEGTKNLSKSETVKTFLNFAKTNNLVIGAICAAPSVLGKYGILKDKKAVCYDGFENFLDDAKFCDNSVVCDGNIVTAKGAGVSLEFGYVLAELLCGKEMSEKLKLSMKFIKDGKKHEH